MNRRGGFTLVELLTVIIIIAILAGMITGAVSYAVTAVNQAAIRQEIGQLELAVNAYKAEYMEYPPDGVSKQEVTNHITRCYRNASTTIGITDLNGNTVQIAKITPATTLCVFLGPHNADPKRPFQVNLKTDYLTKPFFEFERARLSAKEYSYLPRNCSVPYYYRKPTIANGRANYAAQANFPAYKDPNGNYPGNTSVHWDP